MIVRSKTKWIDEGEKCTKFFCGLENKHCSDKIMYKIISDDNIELTKTEDIIKEQEKYFSNLYKANKNISREHDSKFSRRG